MSDPRPDGRPGELPGAVLFACNHNRVRSPMAEALTKLIYGHRFYVDSAGLKPQEEVDPFVEIVIDEVGGALTRHRSKSFDAVTDTSFDLVISLTPEAQHRAVEMTRGAAVDIEYWPTFDPTLATGSREAVLGAYREARDALLERIRARFGWNGVVRGMNAGSR